MKIQYLGTGAAEGIPAMFCKCEYCAEMRKLGQSHRHTRSQILIDDCMSIDFPPEAYTHSLDFGVDLSSLRYVLITHSHMDHCYMHDFVLRGYKYAELTVPGLSIYGNRDVLDVFTECTAREMKSEVSEKISMNLLEPYREYEIGKYRLLTMRANHDGKDPLLFYLERDGKGYLHLYDTGPFGGEVISYLKKSGAKADLVSFDCTFLGSRASKASRHMGIENDMEVREELISSGICDEGSRYVITHFSHNAHPTDEVLKNIEDEYKVIAAHDGMTIEV